MSDECYRNLACAIIEQALDDYRRALSSIPVLNKKIATAEATNKLKDDIDKLKLKKLKAESTCEEVKRFIHSDWYSTLIDLNGDMLLRGVENKVFAHNKASCVMA